jgi:hypothetical protein
MTGWWRALTQSPTVRVTLCSPNSMVCSASLPLRWISTETLCGIISEASHRVKLETIPRLEGCHNNRCMNWLFELALALNGFRPTSIASFPRWVLPVNMRRSS